MKFEFFKNHSALITALISPFIKIKKNRVLFSSFGGQYNDNPKYISIELHESYPEIEIIWVVSDKANEMPPSYAKIVRYGSFEYFKALYSSQVIIDNHAGLRSSKYDRNKFWKYPLYRFLSRKIKTQLCISTWHGTPIKRIAMDEKGARERYIYLSSTNYILSGCQYTAEKLLTSLDGKTPILPYGTPRNDIFFVDTDIKALKNKLGIPIDKKVILYGPTFRDTIDNSGKFQMETLEIDKLLNELTNKFGGEWCFVFRLHNLVQKAIDISKIKRKYSDVNIINGNTYDDMAEYLACADVLLNDYSSSMFDYALSGKPCFIYAPDLQAYSTEDRGFYMNIKDLPFPVSVDQKGLFENIKWFDINSYKINIEKLLDTLGNYEQGTASARVVSDIIRFIKKI